MSTITPSRLNSVEFAANFKALTEDNFEILAEESAKRLATYVSGVPNTVTGPPTTGARVLNEFWRDQYLAEFICTVAGTPGTWKQILPAKVSSNPGSPTTGYWIVRSDLFYADYYWDGAAWQVVVASELLGGVVYQGTWNASATTPRTFLT